MTRTNRKGELFDHLEEIDVVREVTGTHGDTTLSAPEAAGQTVLSVVSETNFAANDLVLIGDGELGELNEVVSTGVGQLTVKYPTAFAHASGEAVKEYAATNLGHITDDGMRMGMGGDDNALNVVTRRLALGYSIGHVEEFFEWSLAGMNVENFATAVGIPETDVTGTGTAADPHRIVLDPERFRADNNLCFQFRGTRHDGTTIIFQMWVAELDFTALNVALARGQVAALPMRARATSGVAVITYL